RSRYRAAQADSAPSLASLRVASNSGPRGTRVLDGEATRCFGGAGRRATFRARLLSIDSPDRWLSNDRPFRHSSTQSSLSVDYRSSWLGPAHALVEEGSR